MAGLGPDRLVSHGPGFPTEPSSCPKLEQIEPTRMQQAKTKQKSFGQSKSLCHCMFKVIKLAIKDFRNARVFETGILYTIILRSFSSGCLADEMLAQFYSLEAGSTIDASDFTRISVLDDLLRQQLTLEQWFSKGRRRRPRAARQACKGGGKIVTNTKNSFCLPCAQWALPKR